MIEEIKTELERRIARCEKMHPPLMSEKDFTDRENEIYCEECAYREILEFIERLQDKRQIKDREIFHTLLDKLLDSPGDESAIFEYASIEGEDGVPKINRRRFVLSAKVVQIDP